MAHFQIKLAFSCHSSRVWLHNTRTLLVAEGEYTNSASVEDSAVSANKRGAFGRNGGEESANALPLRYLTASSWNGIPSPTKNDIFASPEMPLRSDMRMPCAP